MNFGVFFITISIAVSKAWASYDTEDLSAVFVDEAETRELRRREDGSMDQRCNRRLQSCQTGEGSQELPIQSWLSSLNTFRGNNKVQELTSILNAAESTSSASFVNGLSKTRTTGKLTPTIQMFRSTVGDLSGLSLFQGDGNNNVDIAQNLDTIVSILLPLFSFLDSLIGDEQYPNLSLALRITVFFLQVYVALQGDPVTLIVFALRLLVQYFLSTMRDAMALLMFPNASSECFIALMDCNFRKMMNEVMPVLVEMTMDVAAGSETATTP